MTERIGLGGAATAQAAKDAQRPERARDDSPQALFKAFIINLVDGGTDAKAPAASKGTSSEQPVQSTRAGGGKFGSGARADHVQNSSKCTPAETSEGAIEEGQAA